MNITDKQNHIQTVLRRLVYFQLVLLLAVSCRSTELMGSWKREDITPQHYADVGIVLMTSNMSTRSIVEVDLATNLAEHGIKASPTFDIFPFAAQRELFEDTDPEETKQHIRERIRKFGFEAILIITLLDQATETRYNQGSTFSLAVPAYQYNYYGYYQYAYATISTPGYYTTKTTYFLESNLYDVETEGLIWTAQTKTTRDASSIHKDSEIFADIITQEIVKKKALIP